MGCENSASPEKTLGYKKRCDEKRQVYRQALAEKHATGKKIVYVDECDFRAESYRRHGYAPKGECVLGLVSGTRTRTTTLVAARSRISNVLENTMITINEVINMYH